MTRIDFRLLLSVGCFRPSNIEEIADESRTHSLFPPDGFSPFENSESALTEYRLNCRLQRLSRMEQGFMLAIRPAQIPRKSPGQPCSSDNAITVALGI